MQVVLLAPHALQAGDEVVAQQPLPGLAFDAPAAPVQLEQHVRVEMPVDLIEVHVDLARAPERRRRDRHVGARGGAHGVVGEVELLLGLLALGADQLEGGAVQATSWTVKERVRFDRFTVTSDTWETYPILRFSEVPAVEVELVAGQGNPPLGIGECAQGPTAAAIANAVYDALGVRVRSLPLTAEQLIAAMPG